jgi:tripartite-type tricarboxylate transporter receptor subunit TctC
VRRARHGRLSKLDLDANCLSSNVADAKIRERLADLGGLPMPMTPAEFGKFIADETEKWGKVIRAGNIRPE